jgi:hypothetical protein
MIATHNCLGKVNTDFSCEFPMVIAKMEIISSGLIDGSFDDVKESKWALQNMLDDTVNDLKTINEGLYGKPEHESA